MNQFRKWLCAVLAATLIIVPAALMEESTEAAYEIEQPVEEMEVDLNAVAEDEEIIAEEATVDSDALEVSDAGSDGLTITQQPQNSSAAVGEMAMFTVVATGSGLTYKWQFQVGADKPWHDSLLSGHDQSTLYFKVSDHRRDLNYRCVITDATGASVTSTTVSVDGSGSASTPADDTPETVNGVVYESQNGTVVVTGYNGSSSNVTIQSAVNGVAVTKIAANAFRNKTSITSIDLPDSIVEIGDGAFDGCTNLKTIR